jgi:hypothetical protein
MRRQLLATAAAITTTLALAVAVPASAQEEPELFPGPGNIRCDELDLEGLTDIFEDFEGDEDNEFFTATVSEDGTSVTVVAKEGSVILAVIVKGGDDSYIYRSDFTDMVAPPVGQDNTPTISHYDVCIGVEEDDKDNGDKDNGDKDNGDKDEDETAKPTTPAPVPTEVPAGASDGSGGSPALLGFALAGTAAVAGAAVVARRRFLHDS